MKNEKNKWGDHWKRKESSHELNKKGTFTEVWNNNIEGALRKFKKVTLREGVGNDIRKGEYYIKPSERKRMAKRAAIKRHAKMKAEQSEDFILEKSNRNPETSKRMESVLRNR